MALSRSAQEQLWYEKAMLNIIKRHGFTFTDDGRGQLGDVFFLIRKLAPELTGILHMLDLFERRLKQLAGGPGAQRISDIALACAIVGEKVSDDLAYRDIDVAGQLPKTHHLWKDVRGIVKRRVRITDEKGEKFPTTSMDDFIREKKEGRRTGSQTSKMLVSGELGALQRGLMEALEMNMHIKAADIDERLGELISYLDPGDFPIIERALGTTSFDDSVKRAISYQQFLNRISKPQSPQTSTKADCSRLFSQEGKVSDDIQSAQNPSIPKRKQEMEAKKAEGAQRGKGPVAGTRLFCQKGKTADLGPRIPKCRQEIEAKKARDAQRGKGPVVGARFFSQQGNTADSGPSIPKRKQEMEAKKAENAQRGKGPVAGKKGR